MDDNRHQLLAQIGSMYYELEKSQNEIADDLGLSRIKVYRLLKEARQENVVKIIIDWPIERVDQLEKQLAQVFHLKKALIFKSCQFDEATALRWLGQMVARYLENILEDGMTLSVCVGRSTYEVIHAIGSALEIHVNVVQAMGSTPFAVHFMDSGALARELAQKLGGKVLYLPSPLMANNPEEAVVLRKQKLIAHTLTTTCKSDILLVGIGNLDPVTSRYVKADMISAKKLRALAEDGAVGDIGGQFITFTGTLHPTLYNQCMIGLTLEEMNRIPNTIAVAIGASKVKAILGSLRTGVIDVLCTDLDTAREVLKLQHSSVA
jgi:DNA-binding transcriptional regulator LsrR (DeoR family)